MKTPYLSIVIPVFNEEKRVGKAIEAIKNYFSKKKFQIEVIFVDDGSDDNTTDIISKLAKRLNYRIVSYKPNRGKGYALKQGFADAEGEYILLMDADLSTPIEEFEKFEPLMKEGKKVIIGSRKTKGAKVLKRQPIFRQKLGEGFTLLSNIFGVWGISDFTCGFKVFEKHAGKKIFEKQRIKRWGYDTEILFLAKKYGYEVYEVPINWVNDKRSRVNLVEDVAESFSDLLKIRYYSLMGYYDRDTSIT